jgi:hypothetical protein
LSIDALLLSITPRTLHADEALPLAVFEAQRLADGRYVPLLFTPCTGDQARARYRDIPWLGDELVVISDAGEVWIGPAGFLTCLWALEDYREWSFRLAGPAFEPLAERLFLALSHRRRALAFLFEPECKDGTCSLGR